MGHENLKDILPIFQSTEPYLPIGIFRHRSYHTFLGYSLITTALTTILTSLGCLCLLLPLNCWGPSWRRAISNPYWTHAKLEEDADSVRDKVFMRKLKRNLGSWPFLAATGGAKIALILSMYLCFSITAFLLVKENFGRQPLCGVTQALENLFTSKNKPFFEEFGLINHNQNFLVSFNNELVKHRKAFRDHHKIQKVGFGNSIFKLKQSLANFYHKYKDFSLSSCTAAGEHYHPLNALHFHHEEFINQKIEKELKSAFELGIDLETAAVHLGTIAQNDVVLEAWEMALGEFLDHVMNMMEKFYDFYEIVLNHYSWFVFETKISFGIIVSTLVIYSISLILPKPPLRAILIFSIFSGGLLLGMGTLIFSESIFRLKTCKSVFKILDSKHSMTQFLSGHPALDGLGVGLEDWVEVCLAHDSDGSVEDVVQSKNRKNSLDFGLSILRGFSHDLGYLEGVMDADDADEVGEGHDRANFYDFEPKSVKEFYKFLDDFEQLELSKAASRGYVQQKNDPRAALKVLNEAIACTKNYATFSKNDCKEASKIVKFDKNGIEEHRGLDSCLILDKNSPEDLQLKNVYKGSCMDFNQIQEAQRAYNTLQSCLPEHTNLARDLKRDFAQIRINVKKYLFSFKTIKKEYHYNRNLFADSILKHQGLNSTVKEALNCKELRTSFHIALSNVCYHPYSVRYSAYSGLLILAGGFILVGLVAVRLVELVKRFAGLEVGPEVERIEMIERKREEANRVVRTAEYYHATSQNH